jgi:hypothetical protein
MAAFAITSAAKSEIRARLESSACEAPTVALIDSSQSFEMDAATGEALAKANSEEQLAFAMKQYTDRKASLDFRLEVGIYEAARCRAQDLVLLEGVPFAMPQEMREDFTDYILDYVNGRFALKHGDRVFIRLMDVRRNDESAV